jgi:hypothetical protein
MLKLRLDTSYPTLSNENKTASGGSFNGGAK